MNDNVNHPNHYCQGGVECIDAMEAAFGKKELATYCKIAAFKYIWRLEHKNGIEDVKKAIWYLNKYVELKTNNADDIDAECGYENPLDDDNKYNNHPCDENCKHYYPINVNNDWCGEHCRLANIAGTTAYSTLPNCYEQNS